MKITKKSERYVVRGNDLIESTYRSGSLQSERLILFAISKIDFNDEDFKTYDLSVAEFAQLIGTSTHCLYDQIEAMTDDLMKIVLTIKKDKNKSDFIKMNWFSYVEYISKQGILRVRFDPNLKTYLLQLKSCYTMHQISILFGFKSLYSIKIFSLLTQYLSLGRRTMTISFLREHFQLLSHEYKNYFDFKKRTLDVAVKEINLTTNYTVNYKEIKNGRNIVSTEWTIHQRDYIQNFTDSKRISPKRYSYQKKQY